MTIPEIIYQRAMKEGFTNEAASALLANIQAEGESILTKANEEQVRILKEAAEARERIVREAKEQAQIEGGKILAEVRRQIQMEKEDAIRDIRQQVAILSVDIAEKVLRKNLDTDKEQMAMIDRMLDELTNVSKN